MKRSLRQVLTLGENLGAFGAVISAMGCAMCFPAIAGLGGLLGLGFLAQWEGLFVNALLPGFAWLMLVLQVLGWFAHRQWGAVCWAWLGRYCCCSRCIPGSVMAGVPGSPTPRWRGWWPSRSGTCCGRPIAVAMTRSVRPDGAGAAASRTGLTGMPLSVALSLRSRKAVRHPC